MKIRLIVATNDAIYAEKFYNGAMQQRDDVDVSICTDYAKLDAIMSTSFYDVCMIESDGANFVDRNKAKLWLLLRDDHKDTGSNFSELQYVEKYQRISTLLSQVIGLYAQIAPEAAVPGKNGKITVVWSPAGGVGKTTLALAKAAGAAREKKKVRYLNLESFCGTPVLFQEPGNSLSAVFEEMFENVALQIQGLQSIDRSTGMSYFGQPANYDDLNMLTCEETGLLIKAAQCDVDELIIDLSSICDKKTVETFEIADQIVLVTDNSRIAQCKLQQFMTQNNVYRKFMNKMMLIANKGATVSAAQEISMIRLPLIQSTDPIAVYTKLAANKF